MGEDQGMGGVEEILSQIDDAVEDWSVSADAMRCNAATPAYDARGLTVWETSSWIVPTLRDGDAVLFAGHRYTVREVRGPAGCTYSLVFDAP